MRRIQTASPSPRSTVSSSPERSRFPILGVCLSAIFLCAFVDTENPNRKLELSAHEESLRYAREGLPRQTIDAHWLTSPGKDLLHPKSPRQYRHLHTMIAAAFYAKRMDRRLQAFEWLESYKCENKIACEEALTFFDTALKANSLIMSDALRTRAEKIKVAFMAQDAGAAPKPKAEGLCANGSLPWRWLALALQLYLPPYRTAMHYEGCGNLNSTPKKCSSTEAMLNDLLRWSGQDRLSSSYVRFFEFKHVDGLTRTEIQFTCEGGIKQSFQIECTVPKLEDRPPKEYPHKIECREFLKK